MISLVMYPSPQDIFKAENQELSVALAVNNYWQPIESWSLAALTMSQNGLVLSSATTAFFVLFVLYAVFANENQKLSLLLSYKKLSEQKQHLIKAIENVKDKKNITNQAIINEFQQISRKPVSETLLLDEMSQIENAGLVRKVLENKGDTPFLLWKIQLPKTNCKLSRLKRILLFSSSR